MDAGFRSRATLFVLAGAEAGAARRPAGEKQKSARRRTARPRAGVGALEPQGAARGVKARLGITERLLAEGATSGSTASRSTSQRAPGWEAVVEADGVTKAYGDRVLFDDLAFSLPPGGIVGVVGPNGAGRNDLCRLIVGEEQPDSGVLRLGDSVALAYVDQARAGLEPDTSVWKEISGGHDTIEARNARGQLAARNASRGSGFTRSDQQKRIKDLVRG